MVNPLGRAKEGKGKSNFINTHRESVPKIIEKIIYEADVIIEVLDARFIEKTRNIELENIVKKLGKKLIYIFNKSDLVNVAHMKEKVELEDLRPGIFFSSKDRKGSAVLKKLIKIEAGKIDKDSVNIGVIGYPNTGKSSLINLLVGRSIARVSSEAGHTKGMQKIKISNGIYLIDTPGIIPVAEKIYGERIRTRHLQIGAITWDRAKNPDMIVFNLMKEFPNVIEEYYKIDAKEDIEALIEQLGRKLHYLRKGNEVDEDRTAKKILRDWQEGKIKIR